MGRKTKVSRRKRTKSVKFESQTEKRKRSRSTRSRKPSVAVSESDLPSGGEEMVGCVAFGRHGRETKQNRRKRSRSVKYERKANHRRHSRAKTSMGSVKWAKIREL